jgi:hypothetical protein
MCSLVARWWTLMTMRANVIELVGAVITGYLAHGY